MRWDEWYDAVSIGHEHRGSTFLRNCDTTTVKKRDVAQVREDWGGLAGLFEGAVMLVVWTN
jgi:hypothetical protein